MKVVILAGGGGTRLWPLSRKSKPKQLLALSSKQTLLAETIIRLNKNIPLNKIFVSTTAELSSQVRREKISTSQLIIEPKSKGTLAAIGLICQKFKSEPDETVVIVNSDQVVGKPKNFSKAIKAADKYLAANPTKVVLLAVKPDYPETGYGYIQAGKMLTKISQVKIFQLKNFKEKPDLKKAKSYIKQGYYWNPAFFVFKPQTMLGLYQAHQPQLLALLNNKDYVKKWSQLDSNSVDYGILEKAKSSLVCLPVDLDWADIGNWRSIFLNYLPKGQANLTQGQVLSVDSQGCLLYNYKAKNILTGFGLKNLVIVQTAEATLVCDLNQADNIRKLVATLKRVGLSKYL